MRFGHTENYRAPWRERLAETEGTYTKIDGGCLQQGAWDVPQPAEEDRRRVKVHAWLAELVIGR
jgi:hypothetical protein